MGNETSSVLSQSVRALPNQIRERINNEEDVISNGCSYSNFIAAMKEINSICQNNKDENGCYLYIYLKKGSDRTVFWRVTARLGCVEYSKAKDEVQSFRLINFKQFIQLYHRVKSEILCSSCQGVPCTSVAVGNTELRNVSTETPPTRLVSQLFGDPDINSKFETPEEDTSKQSNELKEHGSSKNNEDECCICMERKVEMILPCCHGYCTPCIEQWWLYCEAHNDDMAHLQELFNIPPCPEKSCPMCRKSLDDETDSWVLSERPDQSQIKEELQKLKFKTKT